MTRYQIEIVSDTVCPWCYVGKKRLDAAIAQHRARNPGDTFTTVWKPFQLIPDATRSVDKQAYYEKRFGAQRTQLMQGHLAKVGAQVGINFAFGGKTGTTRDSHRLIQLAGEKSEETQPRVVEQLFKSYFEENEDISSREVIIAQGIRAGLDPKETREWIESEQGSGQLEWELLQTREQSIGGVPHFTINGTYQVQGAEEPAAFLKAFELVRAAEARE